MRQWPGMKDALINVILIIGNIATYITSIQGIPILVALISNLNVHKNIVLKMPYAL